MSDELCFKPVDLFRYENARLTYENSVLRSELKACHAREFKRLAEERIALIQAELSAKLREAENDVNQSIAETHKHQSDLMKVQAELEQEYSLDFHNISYDDKTGRIIVLRCTDNNDLDT